MVAAVAVVAVNYAARAGFAIHRNAIELMHLLGARDQHIAAQFQFQALAMAVRGGIVGFGLAAATVAVFGVVGGQVEAPLLPALRLGLGGWAALGAVPVATAVIAVFTARAIVHRALARMP
jgi:cell division transport system permease protein